MMMMSARHDVLAQQLMLIVSIICSKLYRHVIEAQLLHMLDRAGAASQALHDPCRIQSEAIFQSLLG